jgi:hypothetical protein
MRGAVPHLCCFTVHYFTHYTLNWIATRYGLDGLGSNPIVGEICRTRPDLPQDPPSLLYKGKGKVRLWVFQHLCLEGVLYSYPNEFLHSSPEPLHTKRRERPLSVKEGTISEFS